MLLNHRHQCDEAIYHTWAKRQVYKHGGMGKATSDGLDRVRTRKQGIPSHPPPLKDTLLNNHPLCLSLGGSAVPTTITDHALMSTAYS